MRPFSRYAALLGLGFLLFSILHAQEETPAFVPREGANQPLGDAKGIFPGRVTWVRDPAACPWDGHTGNWWAPGNINEEALARLVSSSLRALSGGRTDAEAWQKLFHHFNMTHGRGARGWQPGEVVVVKINVNNTYDIGDVDNDIDQSPQATRALLRQLTGPAGIDQRDIVIYDASVGWKTRALPDRLFKPLHEEFPEVRWMDARGGGGREAVEWEDQAISFSSPEVELGTQLPKVVADAAYLINFALLKGHEISGVTLCAKNHFGSIRYPQKDHGKYVNEAKGNPGDYSAYVDLMGSPKLGGKTLLYILDGLYGMQTNVGAPQDPRDRWKRLFHGEWSASYFMSQDPVAIDSVGLDFLLAEFQGELGYSGAKAFPKGSGQNCDNYLIEAARGTNAKFGPYHPNGVLVGSLGVHEHWNNPLDRQYSRNLSATGTGIELVQVQPSEAPADASGTLPVQVEVDASKGLGPLNPFWRFFGADEPNYATMKDGRKLLGELGELRPRQVYFRAHNLLSSGDGTPALKWGSTNLYSEDAQGRPVYDWMIIDRLFDTYLERGVRPYVQLGFMPEALSIHPQPYQHDWRPGLPYARILTGWAYPPKDYNKWRELAYQWARHCVERYGRAEVETWYWEVWNEPNGLYWKGTPEEWYKLHDYAIDGIRRALPTARVGGPHTAGSGGEFMDHFLQHIVSGRNEASGAIGTPTDFLAFHAKGQPEFVDGHVRMGIRAQLAAINSGFSKIAAIPELRAKPIILGESDPDGCAACQGPQLGYRAGTLYSSYVAESFARTYELAELHAVKLEGAVTWAFEFEDQGYFAGQRVLASNGIDLPVLNVFRMLSKMGGQRVTTQSSAALPLSEMLAQGVRAAPDISALACLDGDKLGVLLWYYHDDDVAGPVADIRLTLAKLPWRQGALRVTRYLVDESHGNAFTEWKRLGSPMAPSEQQYERLQQAGRLIPLETPQGPLQIREGMVQVPLQLHRQGVLFLLFEH